MMLVFFTCLFCFNSFCQWFVGIKLQDVKNLLKGPYDINEKFRALKINRSVKTLFHDLGQNTLEICNLGKKYNSILRMKPQSYCKTNFR